jgi:general secretion pathway protein H
MSEADQRGFTLLEMVCVLAIIAIIVAVLLPSIPRQTSRARLQAYALEAAALLKSDRAASMRDRIEVTTLVDASGRMIRSGASPASVRIPDDVDFEALLPRRCQNRPIFSIISFFPDGMSCGGAIMLSRADLRLEIRVNWLTGRIDIVPRPLANG